MYLNKLNNIILYNNNRYNNHNYIVNYTSFPGPPDLGLQCGSFPRKFDCSPPGRRSRTPFFFTIIEYFFLIKKQYILIEKNWAPFLIKIIKIHQKIS